MNFRVVDGKYSDETKFDSFEKDYLNPNITSTELKDKYGLSKGIFNQWRNIVREKHGLKRKPVPAKYYVEDKSAYVIRKLINRKTTYIGRIPKEKGLQGVNTAIECCKELDWNVDECRKTIKELAR